MSSSIQARSRRRAGRAVARSFIHLFPTFAVGALAIHAAPAAAQTSTYVVSVRQDVAPDQKQIFATLADAVSNVAGSQSSAALIDVYPGTYVLNKTVVVDMPTGTTLTIAAHDPSNRPLFSGAQTTISGGWHQDANGYAEYVFPSTPALFRSLYASDGVVRRRSRYPDYPLAAPIQGHNGTNDILVSQNDLHLDWLQAGDAEVVAMIGYRAPRVAALTSRVSAAANGNYDLTTPFAMLPAASDSNGNYRFYVENIPQLAYGQWRYDAAHATLVYRPLPTETINGCTPTGGCQIVTTATSAPVVFTVPNPAFDHDPLIRVGVGPTYTMPNSAQLKGDFSKAHFASNVTLTNLVFEYTDWSFTGDNNSPNANIPTAGLPAEYAGGQALSTTTPPAAPADPTHVVQPATLAPAVELFCNGCTVQSSAFADTGGHGLRINGGSNKVLNNTFVRIGGNGIVVGNRWQRATTDAVVTAGSVIKGNALRQIGVRHPEGVAIISYASSGNMIMSNTIDDVAYSGISVGFAQSAEYTLDNNQIADNRISNVLQQTDDGGAIYVCGPQGGPLANAAPIGSKITHNFIQGVPAHRWQLRWVGFYGLYFDKSSDGFSVTDNFVGPSTSGQVKLSHTGTIALSDNYFVAGLVDWIAAAPPAGSYLNTSQPLKAYQPGPVLEVTGGSDSSLHNLFARYYAAFPSGKRYEQDDGSVGKFSLATSDDNYYFDANVTGTFDAACLLGIVTPSCPGQNSPYWTLDQHSQRQLCLPAGSSSCAPDDPLLTTNRSTPVAGDPTSYLPQASDVALASNSLALTGGYVTSSLQFASTGAPPVVPMLSPSGGKPLTAKPSAKPARAAAQVSR